MKKFSKDQIARRDALSLKLHDAHTELEAKIEALNGAIDEKWADVETALTAYNETIVETNEFQEEIQEEIQSYIDEKSDNWREGDRGQQYDSWHSAFDAFEEVELEQPEHVEMPENPSEDLDGRPTSPDEV